MGTPGGPRPSILLRRALPQPYDVGALLSFLGRRAVPGIEAVEGTAYARTVHVGSGSAVLRAEFDTADASVELQAWLTARADPAAALRALEAVLDLDTDTGAADRVLAADTALAPLVRARPGLRSPGAADGFELAVRAVLGQQVSVAAARTVAGRLVVTLGETLPARLRPAGAALGLTALFPAPEAISGAPDTVLPFPATRRRALRALAASVAAGELRLAPGVDPAATQAALLALPGIGPWTASYVAMRALGDTDAFLPTDLGVRQGAERVGLPAAPVELAARAERWRPWRTHAVHHLWAALSEPPTVVRAPAPSG